MEWLTSGGEIFHRTCGGRAAWTPASEQTCRGCGVAIPDAMQGAAQAQARARTSAPRVGTDRTRATRKLLEDLSRRTGRKPG